MSAMTDLDEPVTIGFKGTKETNLKLQEIAHQRRTTVSALLRERANEIIEESDVDFEDSPLFAKP